MSLSSVVDPLIVATSALTLGIHLSLYAGIVLALRRPRPPSLSLPSATLVVPCRNEAPGIGGLFESLAGQRDQEFTLVLVDDRSTDDTYERMAEFAGRLPARVTIERIMSVPAGANPKQHALDRGVERADGELFLFTDGDCLLPPSWVGALRAPFADPSVGLAIGPITTSIAEGALARFHAFEHLFKYAYSAGAAGIGAAGGGFGNNLAIRKEALAAIGGIGSLRHSTTEDAAMIQAVRATGRWRVRALFNEGSTVTTAPLPSLRAIAAQEARWHVGGLFYSDAPTRLTFGYLMVYLTVSVLALPLAPLYPRLLLLGATSFVTMGLMAAASGLLTRRRFASYWLPFVPNLLLTMGLNAFLTVRAFVTRRVTWKGSRL